MKIINIIKNKVNQLLESIGYAFVGCRVDIEALEEHNDIIASRIDNAFNEIKEIESLSDDNNSSISYINDDIDGLDSRIKRLESAQREEVNANCVNDLVSIEFVDYLMSYIDVFDYDKSAIRRDLICALVDDDRYNVTINSSKRKV